MKTIAFTIGLLIITLSLFSCTSGDKGNNKKRKPIYYSVTSSVDESRDILNDKTTYLGEEISVPFRSDGGVKFIDVKVNGMSLEMIFDTGCSDALISVAEANYLYQKGKLSRNDIVGFTQSQIADGRIIENMVINLREVVIGDKIYCHNVMAGVSANVNAPLLLGNSALDQVATYTIDNENKTINFKLK